MLCSLLHKIDSDMRAGGAVPPAERARSGPGGMYAKLSIIFVAQDATSARRASFSLQQHSPRMV
jgi:hypothetical protein